MAHTLFISDCHLDKARPHIIRSFKAFLLDHAMQADALYILGDLFDYWIGDDDGVQRFTDSIAALRQLSRQTPVYFLHGNRDFLIGAEFTRQTNCTLLDQPKVIDLYGRRTLILHGDILCTNDNVYHRYRRIAQNPVTKWLYLRLNLKHRRKIAQWLRYASKKTVQNTAPVIMDTDNATVISYFRHYSVEQMIHGHTHKPAAHRETSGCRVIQRVVLGDWYEQGSFLRAENDRMELVYLPM